jgi:hypothetical protein
MDPIEAGWKNAESFSLMLFTVQWRTCKYINKSSNLIKDGVFRKDERNLAKVKVRPTTGQEGPESK